MKILLCVLIACVCIVYLIRVRRRAAEPEFLVRGILSGEKLGYMMSSLAFGAKKTRKGNGVSLRTIRRRIYGARRAIDKRIALGKEPEECERTYYDNFYIIEETLRQLESSKKALRRLPHVHGVPRLYAACEFLVKSVGGFISRDTLQAALCAYSAETPLSYTEICMLDNMLGFVLCEYLAIYAHKLSRMGEWMQRGEEDAQMSRIDYALLRYDSYVYGRCKEGESSVLQENCRLNGEELRQKQEDFLLRVAEYNARIAAAIHSLHTKKSVLTDSFVRSLSPVYGLLEAGDATFCRLSGATQSLYLSEIARAAKKRRILETAVAKEVLYRSAREEKDIAFFILPSPRSFAMQWGYIGLFLSVWLTLSVLCAFLLPRSAWWYVFPGVSILWYAADFIWRKAVKRVVRRRHLPAYASKYLDAEKNATTVLLPCFAANSTDIESAFRQAETLTAANPEPLFSFCILFDYPKSMAQDAAGDEELSRKIRAEYERNPAKNLSILVRKRKRIAGDEAYQGYEKKRGAILDFNRYLRTGEGEFLLRLGTVNRSSKYVITLDSDTLTNDCAALVCTKAHPYCVAPILALQCKPARKTSVYAKLYAGETGPGRYRRSSENLVHDLFGMGNYTGKGIYDVAAFDEKLDGFFPDNRILSHDYIEGAVAGCMESSASACEDFPQTFAGDFARTQRWLRGDWQLLPYLGRHVRNREGQKIRNPIAPVSAFSVFGNLLLSSVPIAQILLLILNLCFELSVTGIILAFLPQILRMIWSLSALWRAPRQMLLEWVRCIFELSVLPTVAFYKLCAVIVTLCRLITRRNLLQWSVSAHTNGNVVFLPNIIASAVFAATAAVFRLHFFFYPVSALFFVGVFLPVLFSRTPAVKEHSAAYLSVLADTAKQTFLYFCAGQELYALPCDCYQADNAKGWCARTSPTNIGMALVAYASAYEMGLTDKEQLLKYTERIISAVEKCEKYRGNLYNWYDCATLDVLPKRFVSTVDSGNFVAALSLMSTYTEGTLRERIDALIENTDLGMLYDSERNLLYIGYDAENREYTPNHYDLLGSESSLTYLAACAYGKIPKEAFYSLDRKAVRCGRNITVYSWTGGMFEYLMTRLFVAPQDGTLPAQAMKGAVRAHIRYARRNKSDVWGISECRYNAFDDGGGNLYRAFGVPDIAYSNVPAHPPYAPYAVFLALPYCTEKEFLRGVHRFTEAGTFGEYGYCEALDGNTPVRSFMTHHQGMILAACANAEKSDCLVRRLSALPQWRSAQLLCGEEKIDGARSKRQYDVSAKAKPMEDAGVYLCKCARLTMIATSRDTRLRYADKCVLQGLRITAESDTNEDLLQGNFYGGAQAVWSKREDKFVSQASLVVLPSPLSVAVTVRYRNLSSSAAQVRFTSYAEPILTRAEDYEAHPAYSRMFIETGKGEDERCVWARRRGEGITVSHCIGYNGVVTYTDDKCRYFGRGRGHEDGQNLNPCLSGAFTVVLQAGETCTFTCYFLLAETTDKAEQAVRLALSPDCVQRGRGAAHQLAAAVPTAVRIAARKLLDREYDAVALDGIPLDKPTIACPVPMIDTAQLRKLLRQYRLLYEMGFDFHLVLFCRKRRNEYPACYYEAEKETELSGIRSVAGGAVVTVYGCNDEETYERLKRHSTRQVSSRRVMLCDGCLVPYSDAIARQNCVAGKKSESEELPAKLPIVKELGIGGFTAEDAYAIDLTQTDTPAPWCNILSDGNIGTVMTESGGGFTFGGNSRQQKLTEWHNDPVAEEVSEMVAVCRGAAAWSIAKRPLPAPRARYTVTHARGYSVYRCDCDGIDAQTTAFISRIDSRKIYRVEIHNHTEAPASLGILCAVRPVLGDFRRNTLPSMQVDATEAGLHMRCGFTANEAYLHCDRRVTPIGADIADGGLVMYDTLTKSERFWGIITPLTLSGGETQTVYFSLSEECPDSFDDLPSAEAQAVAFYDALSRVTFDGEYGYLTKWLPYQVYNSRFMARTGFYQVSGAYGFRDQLQDCLALLYCNPQIVRAHILECAKHQFREGDVQHWWHPPAIGVRTHICDDRLWLPYVTCEYVAVTGDLAILEESVPFLRDVPIAPQDASVYVQAEFTQGHASLYEHCLRAILVSLDFGENGLVRMRGGDWNDAMDKVGESGIGTSVWCTMFLHAVIERFLPHVRESEMRDRLIRTNTAIYGAICNATEGDRFLRAFCDDGRVLGSSDSVACKIDLLTQSWSVLAGIGTSEQKRIALETAYGILCDETHRLVRLFDPPFTSPEGVGYVGKYPLYVRENGGQYTQAAVWYVQALFLSGQTERANRLLQWLTPASRSMTRSDAETYCVEPYVVAADIYGGPNAGKGGWTWYTGSAAWLYKCLVENYAGIRIRGNVAHFSPALPASTRELNVTLSFEGERISVKIVNSSGAGAWRIRIGGVIYNTSSLKLSKSLAGKEIAVVRLP